MEFVTISHWDVPNATDDMMDEAKEKFMPMILATGADNVYMVRTGDNTVSVVTHFPDEALGKAQEEERAKGKTYDDSTPVEATAREIPWMAAIVTPREHDRLLLCLHGEVHTTS